MFRIYYADGTVVEGSGRGDWKKAPDTDVQVVAQVPMQAQTMRWHYSQGPVRDRDLWTGQDIYDPFGFGAKSGSLIPDVEYFAIWDRACAD